MATETELTLTKILRAAITDRQAEGLSSDGQVWRDILRISGEQKIPAMVYQAVYSSEGFMAQDASLREQFRQSARVTVVSQSQRSARFLAIYSELRKNGITPLVLKGHICRRLYPKPDFRPSSDEDLLIRRSDFSRCHRILKENGFIPCRNSDPHADREIGYRSPDRVLKLEVSVMPFSPESSAGRSMNGFLCDIFDTPVVHSFDGVRVFSPGHTDHMLYLICHAFKHFIHSGVGIRQLCDIMVYSRTYAQGIDWARILSSLEKLNADRWFASIMVLCEKYLGLDRVEYGVPDSVFAGAGETDELLSDILSGGIYGTADIVRTHSSNMTLAAVENEISAERKHRGTLRKALFPPASALEERYVYLKDHPYLLPAAWIARIFDYGMSTVKSGRKMTESYEIGQKRIALLRKYSVLREGADRRDK